jgi:CHASE2 domain-containing sensor protein
MRYRNFDLRIWALDGGRYRLEAEAEGHGQATAEARLDPHDAELEARLRRLAARETDEETLEALGAALFDRLFVGEVRRRFDSSFGDVEGEGDAGLRLRLRIEPAEVAALPWELLYDRCFLATRVTSPVVRYVQAPKAERELRTAVPLRLLVAIPHCSRELPGAENERGVIARALAELEREVEAVYLHELYGDGQVTWTRVRERLAERAGGYHCFHFVGHGGFRGDHGHVLLDPEDGDDGLVSDRELARLFTNHQAMKLVVLNACESATQSTSRPLAGCAAELVKEGVPAVVAMQYAVRDEAAVAFTRSFYHSLFRSAERGRVDVAISQGRNVLAAKHPGQRELATPVLFMHTATGVLFAPESGSRWRDLPFSTRARHTLEAAREETGSEEEAELFGRRIREARRIVRTAFAVSLAVFALLWLGALDFFAVETGAEFLTMAVGDTFATPELSDDIRIVTLDPARSGLRERKTELIRRLAAAGAAVVVLDFHYEVAEDDGFARDPETGLELVAAIREVRPTTAVVVGARSLAGTELAAPESLRQVAAGVGHVCPETRLGWARSLPVSVAKHDRSLPSLALAAYAAYRGGTVLDRAPEAGGPEEGEAVVLLPGAGRIRFAPSELEVPEKAPGGACDVIGKGDVVAHRYLRLKPLVALEERTVDAEDFETLDDPRKTFRGKVVLVGIRGAGDTIEDLAGERPGVFWHADALDNLLRDELIRPLSDPAQLPIMLALAGAAAALRLRFRRRRAVRRALGALALVLFVALSVYSYAAINLLINPAYHLVAFAVAWWWAGRAGDRWLA